MLYWFLLGDNMVSYEYLGYFEDVKFVFFFEFICIWLIGFVYEFIGLVFVGIVVFLMLCFFIYLFFDLSFNMVINNLIGNVFGLIGVVIVDIVI